MNVFIDTNVLLDVMLERRGFYRDSLAVWSLAEQGKIAGQISVISFNNIYYIVRKIRSRKTADRVLVMLRDVFTPISLDGKILNQAIAAGFADFEDAIQYYSALHADASCIISRNPDHFPKSPRDRGYDLPVLSPAEFLAAYSLT